MMALTSPLEPSQVRWKGSHYWQRLAVVPRTFLKSHTSLIAGLETVKSARAPRRATEETRAREMSVVNISVGFYKEWTGIWREKERAM